MKTTTSITIDANLLQKAKIMKINVSKLVNDVLKGIMLTDAEQINIFDIENELENLNKTMLELSTKQNELLAQKMAYNEKKRKRQQKNFKDVLREAETIKRSGVLNRL